MMGYGAITLLLLALAVAVALPSSVAEGRGARTGSSTEAFPSPAQAQEKNPTGTILTLMSVEAASHESSFIPDAYVKWNDKGGHNPPHDDVAAQRNSFTSEAPSPAQAQEEDPTDTTSMLMSVEAASRESSFTPEAYNVKWNGKGGHHPPHDGVATQRNSFTPEAPSPAQAQEEDPTDTTSTLMSAEAASRESSFTPEAYNVKWNGKGGHHPPHDGWNGKRGGHKPPHDDGVAASYVAETTTLARGHDDLHVATGMLFTRKSMFPGAVLPEGTKFAGNGFPDPRRFVFREDADAIPFSYKQIDTILRTFGIPRGSNKADQVAATLRTCEDESREPHTCATSEQAEVDFAASSLATRTSEVRAIVTVVHGKEDAARYTVAPNGVARVGKAGGGAMVTCHLMAYPYMVHYCHRPADVEALRVELMGLGDGDGHAAAASGATAIAMCHANTTSWDTRYFQMLNATRGEEICHFMPRNYVLWLPAAAL